jgi:hypothetical protein
MQLAAFCYVVQEAELKARTFVRRCLAKLTRKDKRIDLKTAAMVVLCVHDGNNADGFHF